MTARLSYEPSVQALVADILPAETRVLGGDRAMRRRVSWPVVVRATGLGQVEGGELVIVPPGRESSVIPHLSELERGGIEAVMMSPGASVDEELAAEVGIPLILTPGVREPRRLRDEAERYISRRRRELFANDQEVHRKLIDAAIGGATIQQLLDVAGNRAGRRIVLDGENGLLSSGVGPVSTDDGAFGLARAVSGRSGSDAVALEGQPPILSVPVMAGSSRRGIALMFDTTSGTIDEDEIVLTTFASAAAIVLAREPAPQLPSLDEIMRTALVELDGAPGEWVALALVDSDAGVVRLSHVARAELTVRDIEGLIFRENEALILLVQHRFIGSWESVFASLLLRLGAKTLQGGVGRSRAGASGARDSIHEALEAVRWGSSGLTRYESVELAALLDRLPRRKEFVAARLGPILARQDLLHTLAAYFQTGRRGTETAERLQVHRNTVLYRLRRVRELLGVDIDDGSSAFELELALRLRDLSDSDATAASNIG